MLVLLQAVAFAGCVLFDLLPSTEVECRFGVPLGTWGSPPPAGEYAPSFCADPASVDTGAPAQCREI